MPKTAEQLHDDLKTAVDRIEGLYRIIYGYNTLGEKPSNEQEYIAERYMIDTRAMLANADGWTGRQCKHCEGTTDDETPGAEVEGGCKGCNGTGKENLLIEQANGI